MFRKTILLTACIALTVGLFAQTKPKKVILPGNGRLDIEKFNKRIDLKMDLSKLSLSELRVLRNAFAARQGYIFKSADLRSIYSQTSWYDSLMWKRFDAEEAAGTFDENNGNAYGQRPVTLKKEEIDFISKIKQYENKILQNRTNLPKGHIVNLDLLLNPFQLETFDPRLKEALGRNGFAIVPDNKLQLFHIYEKNDYSNFPSFVTTDLYLQLFHLYFDAVLRDVEEKKLDSLTTLFCQEMYKRMTTLVTNPATGKETRRSAAFCQAYFGIALALETDKLPDDITDTYREMAAYEVEKVNASENAGSEFLDYKDVQFPYSLFRPRGHYTRSERIKHYFRTMMWLQTVPFGTDKADQLKCAALLANTIGSDNNLQKAYNALFEPITFLFGEPDNITIMQVYDLMKTAYPNVEKLLANKKMLSQLREQIEQVAKKQTRIRPKYELTSPYKINLMPQRYMPDAEVLNEMVDAINKPTKRNVPSGLDVFAAMGCPAAERILLNERGEAKRWELFTTVLDSMKTRMGQINWQATLATRWINALKQLNQPTENAPYFMRTPQWDKKNLNTSLASWAELKHDAILYAKQPMGAECGSGGPPEPVVKGYVEPNVKFWAKAVELTTTLEKVLKKYGLMTDKAERTTERVKEMAEFLLKISQKELAKNTPLTEEEYNNIEIIGSTFENISLDLVRSDDAFLDGWDNVEGADKSIAVVADVYTANLPNNPNHSILYEATGPAYEIYVAVPIDNELYLMRGAVFSYREFEQSTDQQRLTDEEWQEKLKQKPFLGVPRWMEEITVPLEQTPTDNEEIFYSSGC